MLFRSQLQNSFQQQLREMELKHYQELTVGTRPGELHHSGAVSTTAGPFPPAQAISASEVVALNALQLQVDRLEDDNAQLKVHCDTLFQPVYRLGHPEKCIL